ncbi:hypothetical protein Pelo_10377 [Pelomyxa schiedti]|nr:hypothetical protein Pelo_10377 [Pelomyxa schiedti]
MTGGRGPTTDVILRGAFTEPVSTLEQVRRRVPIDENTPYECPLCNYKRPGWKYYESRARAISSLNSHLYGHYLKGEGQYVRVQERQSREKASKPRSVARARASPVHKRSHHSAARDTGSREKEGRTAHDAWEKAKEVVPNKGSERYTCPYCKIWGKSGWSEYSRRVDAVTGMFHHIKYHWEKGEYVHKSLIRPSPSKIHKSKHKGQQHMHKQKVRLTSTELESSDDSETPTLSKKVASLGASLMSLKAGSRNKPIDCS